MDGPQVPSPRRVAMEHKMLIDKRIGGVILLFMLFGAGWLSAQSVSQADSILARGDTARALRMYETLVDRDLKSTEAHYRAGLIYWARSLKDGKVSRNRRAAERHLRYAARFEPDSAKYLLALANLFRGASEPTMRLQWGKTLRKAHASAVKHHSPELARIEYLLGRMAWERYDRIGRRAAFPPGSPASLPSGIGGDDYRDLKNIWENRVREIDGVGEEEYVRAESHLRAAIDADPMMVDALALLAVVLGDRQRWDEALGAARRTIKANPREWKAWAVRGMILARLQRYREAQADQEKAIALAPPSEARVYADIGRILPRRDSARFASLPTDSSKSFVRLFWGVAQPLLLRGVNEVYSEHLARLTEADILFSDPEMGRRGWNTHKGRVLVRWGPPPIKRNLGPNRQVWIYPELKLFFEFTGQPGYTYSSFAGEHLANYQSRVNSQPASFLNVEAVRTMDSAITQMAQFRAPGTDSTELALFSFVPVGRMAHSVALANMSLHTGVFVLDQQLNLIDEQRTSERIRSRDPDQFELYSYRLTLPHSKLPYLVRVEALIPEVDRAARSSQPLMVRRFTRTDLLMSDVIIAERVEPRDSSPSSWHDFLIAPSAGRIQPNGSLSLLWEIYNLTSDQDSIAHFRVDVTVRVKNVIRKGFGARLFGGIADALGTSAKGDDQIVLSYDADARVRPGGRQVEHLTLALDDAPKANYDLLVTVTDKLTGVSVTSVRKFTVNDGKPGNR